MYHQRTDLASVRGHLSERFQQTIVTQQVYILLTSSFHQFIVLHFEAKIHFCDIIALFVTSKNTRGIDGQLSEMWMNYWKAVHYSWMSC